MNRILKKITTLSVTLLLLTSIAGCGSSSGDNGDKAGSKQVTLKLWHIWASDSESNRKPFLKVLDDFQKANPNIKLDIDETEAKAYDTKIKTAAAANELPDVFYSQAGGYLKSFVDAGKVLDLDDYLKDGTKEKLLPGVLTNMTFNGKVYGLPYTQATAVFFVNKEMFDKNGIKIPENFSELITAVKAFRAKGITPMTVGAKDEWPTTQYFDIMAVRDAGPKACEEALNKKGSYVNPGIIDAAAKFQELVKLKAFNDGALGLTRDESEMPFYEGKIPMYVNGSWTAGNIQKEDCKVKGKILALRFPIIEGGKGDINDFTGGAAEGFYVSSNTKHKAEAVKLLKYITENHSREAYLAGAGIPTWNVSVDESKIDPLTRQIVKNLKQAKTTTLWFNTLLESNDSDTYQKELTELFSLKVTPKKFAEDLQKMNSK
ncbi:extracellular solute-binding protein [Clostridium hydrogenum]|uniref:extracellular solute-binding protein n=1 Tax=Clostridium hydrogenum TaxID=2855764 RepID=UPI001F2F4F22|nr:extracellular solute-binding protein [Clostridium hydrogenum]